MHRNSSAPLSDDALVVRGGSNTPVHVRNRYGTHPSGVPGVSVQSADGVDLAGLAADIPHRRVGVTFVGRVRAAGGDVIRTPGRSPHHATLTLTYPQF